MATQGHEKELVNVEDLKATLQKYKTDISDKKAASTHTHNYAGSSSAGGDATNSDKVDGYHISVVSSMPASPAADTIYIVK